MQMKMTENIGTLGVRYELNGKSPSSGDAAMRGMMRDW